jgi:4-amino-4-deoxy-L-arabinose transferase-like glycosyltransferase
MEGTDPHGRRLALATVALGAAWIAGVWLWARDAPLPPDAAAYGVIARNVARGDGYTESFIPFHPGPYDSVSHLPDLHGLLTPALLAPLFALLGPSAAAIRIPSTVAAGGIALVVFALARRLFGASAAFVAALLLLASPSLFYYAALGTDDTGFTLLVLVTIGALAVAAHERRPRLLVGAGLLAGLAILEKPTGIFLPVLGLVALVVMRRTPAAAVLGLVVPPLLAFAAYLVRNQLAHGSLDFRFGGLEWIWKDSAYEAMMAVYARAPTTLETIRGLGLRRVLEITGEQLAWFAGATFAVRPVVPARLTDVLAVVAVPAFLPSLALVPLPWLARRTTALAALVLATFVAAPAAVCTLWHAEPRYFLIFIPLAALALAGTIGRFRAGRLAMLALAFVSALGLVRSARLLAGRPPHPCQAVIESMKAAGIPGRILTFDPWLVAWLADREAVMIPSGGLDAIASVALRYDTRLLLVHPMLGRPETSPLVAGLEGAAGPLRVTTLQREGACRLARLDVVGDQRP